MKAILMSVDKWMDKNNGTYIQWNISHKKNKIIPFTATWIDLEIIILNEASHKEKDKYPNMVWYHLYVESKKMIQINLFIRQRDSQTEKKNLWLPKEKKGRGDKFGV